MSFRRQSVPPELEAVVSFLRTLRGIHSVRGFLDARLSSLRQARAQCAGVFVRGRAGAV